MSNDIKSSKKAEIFERDEWICYICKCKLIPVDPTSRSKPPPNTATVDHLIPKCLGGSRHSLNLKACCYRCNTFRGYINSDLLCMAKWLVSTGAAEDVQEGVDIIIKTFTDYL